MATAPAEVPRPRPLLAGLRIFGRRLGRVDEQQVPVSVERPGVPPPPLMELMRRSVTRTLALSRNALHNNEGPPRICDLGQCPPDSQKTTSQRGAPCFTRVS